MILGTFNVRGMGNRLKKAAIRHLLDTVNPSILFLQETMHAGSDAISTFLSIRPAWKCCAIDANGQDGWILAAWNPLLAELKPFTVCSGIVLFGKLKGLSLSLYIVNLYGPYRDRQVFWEQVFPNNVMSTRNLILCGDLNFTLSSSEMWGNGRKDDPLAEFMKEHLEAAALMDVIPSYLVPTWNNGRVGTQGLGKRLDRFLINSSLYDRLERIWSWGVATGASDHKAICLEFLTQAKRTIYPFKFNNSWLEEPEFCELISSRWQCIPVEADHSHLSNLTNKLDKIRREAARWERH